MTAIAYDGFSFWRHSDDMGASVAAQKIRKIIQTTEDGLRNANSWNTFGEVIESLNEIYVECSQPNWDGYGAIPIYASAYEEATRFLKSLPRDVASPEVLPEPDGSVGFEWDNGKDRVFTVSLSGRGSIVYAGLNGKGSKAHGTEVFDDSAPKEIIGKIRRIYS